MASTEQTGTEQMTIVEFDVVETTTYRGRVEMDPADFLEATGTALNRATGDQLRDYVADSGITHDELHDSVQDQEWSGLDATGMSEERVAFEVDGMVGDAAVEEVRVLVDPACFREATCSELKSASLT